MSARQQSSIIQRETTAHQVAEILRRRILSGEIPEGEYVRQEALAAELGVSRLPVREALMLLETQGLVTNFKYKGALVVSLSPEEIEEIYALRALLETFLLEHAIPNIDVATLDRAEGIIERSKKVKSLEEWAELNWQFHRSLYEPSAMKLALKTLEQVIVRSDRYFRLQRTISAELKDANDVQHRQIISLLRSGNGRQAIAAMREHIGWNKDDLSVAVARVRGRQAAGKKLLA